MRGTELRRRHHRLLSATAVMVLAAVTAGGLSGCRVVKRPAPPYPTVEWQGAEPSGPLEADPWVQATRKFLEAEAVARNINDFSIPELAKTASRDARSRAARPAIDDVKQGRRPDILPGPTPFLPLSVTPTFRGDPDRAAVRGCKATEWSSEEGKVPAELKGYSVEYRMERLPDGTMRVESTVGIPALECSDATLPIALFVPAPEPSDVTDVKDIVIAERTDLDPVGK
ncbi:hypothetical protein [Arthrobacter sp. EpRS71]|uniref:hypothetical protein n=1 Tax=Arthrobacter sp. EpRS71 TaxID=1743141 RepID=UPI0007489F9E|nr:hypothetical protein [Arthrobacter sp. EpRS71]KUM36328.1 hypothetical protein AR689_20565 [Arthrobacter sp. EpRS71]